MAESTGNGIKSVRSAYSVDETVERLKALLETRAVKLFALIDHSGEAERAGMKMPPTKVLIFGNPAAGTPLMIAAPSSAIDLPLKLLVAEDAGGRVSISWNDPAWLQSRHGFPADLVQNIAVVEALATKAGA